LLAARIAEHFERGLAIDAGVSAYIESTFSAGAPQDIAARLCDPADSESRSLLDLILFPDKAVQLDLEDILAGHRFEQRDQEYVRTLLVARIGRIALRFPDGQKVRVPLPDSSLDGFLARLHLAVDIDPRLRTELEASGDSDALIRIRNHGRTLSGRQADFLCRLIAGLEPQSDQRRACVDLMLALFAENEPDADIPAALAAKKRFFRRNLQRAQKTAALLADSNFETRILQGLHTPHVSATESREGLELVDRVSRAVFGRRLPDEWSDGDLRQVTFDTCEDRADWIRRLS
jgi:hypothetical protein